MIQLKKTVKGIELVDRTQTVLLEAKSINLGEEKISQPGEYEFSGASVIFAHKATLIAWEGSQIVYHFAPGKPSEFERGQFSSAQALVLGEPLANQSKGEFTELLEAYDPQVVVLPDVAAAETRQKEGFKFEPTKVVRLPMTNLPEEGRVFLYLE